MFKVFTGQTAINLLVKLGDDELSSYFTAIESLMKKVSQQEQKSVEEVAKEIVNRLTQGGIIQLFGCGHSQLLTAEPFYRAGGIVPIQPIFIESLMLHEGALQSSKNEKNPAFFKTFEAELDFRPEDVVVVISTSGSNPVPVDVANKAKACGAYVISIQSLNYNASNQPAKHDSGHRLEDVVDGILNTDVPIGDGVLTWEGLAYGPASSVLGNLLLHGTLSRVVEIMVEKGIEPPVFKSSNISGSAAYNAELIAKYEDRIRF